MKKLMIALAAVAVAAGVQAAQYSWSGESVSTGYLGGDDTEQAAGGMAYLFYSGSTDYTILELQAVVEGGTFLSGGWDKLALDSAEIDKTGTFTKDSVEGLAGTTGDSFYAVLVATESYDYETGNSLGKVDPVMAYLTDGYTPGEVKDKGSTPLEFTDVIYPATAGDVWTAQSVPEPTSGLLLLLGVAGLALRRRPA